MKIALENEYRAGTTSNTKMLGYVPPTSRCGFGHHEQAINIMDILEIKQRDKIMNETCGKDDELSQLARLAPPSSRLGRVP